MRPSHTSRTTKLTPDKPSAWLGFLLVTMLLAACGGGAGTSGSAATTVAATSVPAATSAPATTSAPEATAAPAATAVPATSAPEATAAPAATAIPATSAPEATAALAAPEATSAPEATAAPVATAAPEATAAPVPAAPKPTAAPAPSSTGTIVGTVTDRDSGAPLAGVYIVVGYKGLKLSTITGGDGRYTVNNVPAGKAADVFGFTGRGYRYHNSIYDDNLKIVLKPGETYTYDFTTFQLNDPAGEPQVANPSISTDTVAAGQRVTFKLSASGGKGGLSDEVFAVSPQLGRLALLAPAGGDTFSSSFTVPADTPPGDYEFAFFAASNECYDNAVFPKLILHVT